MMDSCINNKKIDKKINSTIKQWVKSNKARLDDIEQNHSYYYQGGPTAEYTSVDFDFEMLETDKAQLEHFVSEMEYAVDRLKHALETIQ
jgi:hypothetical protein